MIDSRTIVREGEYADPLVTELLHAYQLAPNRHRFLTAVCDAVTEVLGVDVAGVVRQREGRWVADVWRAGVSDRGGEPLPEPPEEQISDAIDRNHLHVDDRWSVIPLAMFSRGAQSNLEFRGSEKSPSGSGTELPGTARASDSTGIDVGDIDGELETSALVVGIVRGPGEPRLKELAARLLAAAELVTAGVRQIAIRDRQARRIAELQRILQSAATWQRLDNDDELLRAIADTACELLGCERASIFLWDRRRGKLVGRPALGVAQESLEVDDRAGVVGEVLRTAAPRIWNVGSDEEDRINRSVDRKTEFETRSLVAVPMRASRHPKSSSAAGSPADAAAPGERPGRRDELIGVFEALNRIDSEHPGAGFEPHHAVLLGDLATHAAVAIESLRTRRSLTESRDRLVDDAARATQLIGNHHSMQAVRETASKVAATELTVLVLGNNGTGKEVLARHIHFESNRRHGPFVAVNCAALVESLLESELFGHEKGAFTDAQQTHAGKFELASGGTLFLDEVGDMSPGGQAKLLRVLEEKVVVRVGGSRPIPVDVRVIAATNQPLQELVAGKRFREDLYFRLNVVSMTLPPLRDRGDDLLLLAQHFFDQFCQQIGRRVPALSPEARQTMMAHPWPGNIRELRNTIERVCYLSTGDTIRVEDLMISDPVAAKPLPAAGGESWPQANLLTEATRQFQVAHIDRAIEACQGNMTDAAARLGLHRSNLYRKMRQLGIPTSDPATLSQNTPLDFASPAESRGTRGDS